MKKMYRPRYLNKKKEQVEMPKLITKNYDMEKYSCSIFIDEKMEYYTDQDIKKILFNALLEDSYLIDQMKLKKEWVKGFGKMKYTGSIYVKNRREKWI